ncbi:MAG: hypothetical protein SFX18_05810 [Pirellulales bacterium]|nr:hypothetical protein [Pirellulales bacterium]
MNCLSLVKPLIGGCAHLVIVATIFVSGTMSLHAAFINPSDVTGSFGTDPNTWAGNFPAAINTNTIATVRSTTPWNRPGSLGDASSANTTYQGWDRFTSATATNSPNAGASPNEVDGDPLNPNGTAALTQSVTMGVFLTGGFNIYSPSVQSDYTLTVPNYNLGTGYLTSFLVQMRAATGEINLNSILINGTPISSLPNYSTQLINSTTYSSGFGDTAALDYKLEFTLPGNNATDTIRFSSVVAGGLSFDKLSVDTIANPIPEPGVYGLVVLAMGAGVYGLRRNRVSPGRKVCR